MFQILLADAPIRSALIDHLKQRGILAVFHYVPLHPLSPMGRRYGGKDGDLPVTEEVAGRLLRLPFYFELSAEEQDEVIDAVRGFFETRS